MPDFNDTFIARIDSNSAGNPSLNLVSGEPEVELVFAKLNPTGDFFLDNGSDDPAGTPDSLWDPDTVVFVDGGTTALRFDFEFVGRLPTLNSNGANQVPPNKGPGDKDFLDEQVVLITVYDYPATGDTTRFMFLLDQSNVDPGDMDDFGNGKIDLTGKDEEPPDPPAVCFMAGTLIETPNGTVSVDDIAVGNLVSTRGGGYQSVTWVSSSLHFWKQGTKHDNKPIIISAGSLSGCSPSHDLMVSPQHHILFESDLCQKLFGTKEVLAPAKGLTGLPGVRVMAGKKSAEYYHVMTENHEILIAHGVETESFYPGPTAVRMLNAGQRASLFAVVPALRDDPENGYGPTARKRITRKQAEKLVDAMKAEQKKNVAVS